MKRPIVFSVLAVIACIEAGAQEGTKVPHVSLATVYEVDPTWPQNTAGLKWADVPGIAVDSADRVHCSGEDR
jgi:hypothetical protein